MRLILAKKSMTFTQKGEDIIRNEVIEDLKGGKDDFKLDENKETIDRITQRRLKDEQMKASLHKQKVGVQERKDYYKGLAEKAKEEPQKGKPDGKSQMAETGEVSTADIARHFAKGGTQTELRYAMKVMKATGKDFKSAKNDGLFQAWKKQNDEKIESAKAQMDPSRGGQRTGKLTEEQKMAEKFSKDLPAGFSAKPKENK
jgi:hypothetical protein